MVIHIEKCEPAAVDAVFDECAFLGERISRAKAIRELHGRDESVFPDMWPDLVAFPETTKEVSRILAVCNKHGLPVIAFGAGSSLEGQILAPKGGLSIDMSRMSRILDISSEDMTVTLEPGVTRVRLNEELRATGLFFPVDPGADASIGGMCATRASGTNAVRYGTMRENVVRLTVVLADGRIINTASHARKSSAGYDLTRLFIGSEGTLGIITEITLRLYPIAETIAAAVCAFGGNDDAIGAAQMVIMSGIPVARIEFLDVNGVRALNRHNNTGLPEQPHLFLEFHGNTESVTSMLDNVRKIAQEFGAQAFESAKTAEDRNRLWQARHQAYFAVSQLRAPSRSVVTDACVPISQLGECISRVQEKLDASGLPYAIVGHVGDGNFHTQILLDPDDTDEREKAEVVADFIATQAISLGGTCTGEHGVGMHKQAHLRSELGGAVDIMQDIKNLLDPAGILNPGKVFAPQDMVKQPGPEVR